MYACTLIYSCDLHAFCVSLTVPQPQIHHSGFFFFYLPLTRFIFESLDQAVIKDEGMKTVLY